MRGLMKNPQDLFSYQPRAFISTTGSTRSALAGSHAHVLKKSGLYYCKCPCITSIQQSQVRVAICSRKHEASLRIPILHRADGAAVALQEVTGSHPEVETLLFCPASSACWHLSQIPDILMSFTCHCAAAPQWPPQ